MARRSKRTNPNKNNGTILAKYAVVVCQGSYIECDTCCFTSPTMYEFEDGSCICETCLHGMQPMEYLMAGIFMSGGIYGYGGDSW